MVRPDFLPKLPEAWMAPRGLEMPGAAPSSSCFDAVKDLARFLSILLLLPGNVEQMKAVLDISVVVTFPLGQSFFTVLFGIVDNLECPVCFREELMVSFVCPPHPIDPGSEPLGIRFISSRCHRNNKS